VAPAEPTGPGDDLKQLHVAKADPREPRLGAAIQQLLERGHVRPHKIDDAIGLKAFAMYVEHLDPSKMFLLKSQVDALARDAAKMDDQLRGGDFRLARTGAALIAREREKVAALVAELLAAPLDLTVDETLETDPKKIDYAGSEQERRERWRKNLKREQLERVDRMEESLKAAEKLAASDAGVVDAGAVLELPPATPEEREKKAREELARSYAGRFSRLKKPDPLEAAELFVNAFASVFDPHTLYLPPADQEEFNIQISGSLEGIGAVLSEADEHYITVRELVPGGAAWREGQLEAGDLIMAVKQTNSPAVDVADMRINDVVRMIRGPKGTVVTLTVKKSDKRILPIPITRDVVIVEDAYARGATLNLGPKQAGMGYIQLPSFYGNTRSLRGQTPEREATGDVRALLAYFAKQKSPGVIIDLRGNGGGLLNHANDITGLLIDEGPVVAARNAEGELQVLGDEEPGVVFGGHVIVLVDRFSASASEILAGALQDYGRALIVGTGPTHGKGTVQAMIDLDRLGRAGEESLGVAKLTVQQFFLVDGESTQWRGVIPDVVLPDPAAHVESGERYLENAIPWSKIDPLPAKPWAHHDWTLSALVEKSSVRQAAQPIFAQVTARSEYVLARRKDTVVPLKREAWRALRDKDHEVLDKLELKQDSGPERFSVKRVEYRPQVAAAPVPPTRAAKPQPDRWQETLARDPWVEEALHLLTDMGEKPAAARAPVR
jgi:carboxyl-terminal processing protease